MDGVGIDGTAVTATVQAMERGEQIEEGGCRVGGREPARAGKLAPRQQLPAEEGERGDTGGEQAGSDRVMLAATGGDHGHLQRDAAQDQEARAEPQHGRHGQRLPIRLALTHGVGADEE